MQLLFLLILFLYNIFIFAEDVHNFVTCSRKYSKLGCFSQSQSVSEVPLLTYRDKTSKYYNGTLINWHKFKESLHRYQSIFLYFIYIDSYAYVCIFFFMIFIWYLLTSWLFSLCLFFSIDKHIHFFWGN